MGKVWDIIPPQSKKQEPKVLEVTKKIHRIKPVYFIVPIVVVVALVIGFGAYQMISSASKMRQKPTVAAVTDAKTAKTATPMPVPEETPSIKLLNGTGKTPELKKFQEILTKNGIKIDQTESALNLYEQSIIYYQPKFETTATKIKDLLKDYNPELQKFNQQTVNGIVIVIGSESVKSE